MATVPDQVLFIDEIADFLSSSPSPADVLAYHPSEAVERRFQDLLTKLRENTLTTDEQGQLEQFQQTEILLRLLKARLRAAGA